MNKDSINENENIQEGLERFLSDELGTGDRKKSVSGSYEKINHSEPKIEDIEKSLMKTLDDLTYQSSEPRKLQDAPYQSSAPRKLQDAPYQSSAPKKLQDASYQKSVNKSAVSSYRREILDDEYEEEADESYERESYYKEKRTRDKKPKKVAPPAKPPKKKKVKNKNKKGEKKQAGGFKKFMIFLLFFCLVAFILLNIMVNKAYHKMTYEKSDAALSGPLKEDGVTNILLIGNDSRLNGEDGRSDAMILVSVNPKTKTIYMTSLLRDMYVEIPGYDGNRLNAAYSYGGAALLCQTIKQNFGIEVNRYALVNFQAFAALVDAVDGVDLELSNEEVQWVNAYLNEYNLLEGRDITTDYLDTSLSGNIHLNGPQALAYCRNRYIGTDFGRTERQRKVLNAVMKKLPLKMATNSGELMDGVFTNLTTNLTQTEMTGLSLKAAAYATYDVEQTAIPAEGTYKNATIRKMAVLEVDFEANKKIIQDTIYADEKPQSAEE